MTRPPQQRHTAEDDQSTIEYQLRDATQTITTHEATITELRENNQTLASQLELFGLSCNVRS